MAVTANQVKELREMTGVGMMDCKKALEETGGDMEAAIDWLRTRGLAKAAKKAGRIAAEGLVGVSTDGTRAAIVEVNSETDFVARNEQFQSIVGNVAKLAIEAAGNVEKLAEMPFPGTGRSVSAELTDAIAKIGENMNLRRSAVVEVNDGVIGSYVHNAVKPGMGKLGVIVGIESNGDKAVLAAPRQAARHAHRQHQSGLGVVGRHRSGDRRQGARNLHRAGQGNRQAGRRSSPRWSRAACASSTRKSTLLAQTFVIDGESKVRDIIEKAAKDAGAPIKITKFVRYSLGEGIEKQETDFAAEVAKTSGVPQQPQA